MKITRLENQIGDFDLNIRDVHLEKGLIYGLIGPNGSGKTTFVKSLLGMIPTDNSDIDLGINYNNRAYLSQRPYIIRGSVYDNIVYPLKIRNIKPDEEYIDELLTKMNMIDKKYQHAPSLSSGERQKLSFLRAILYEPELIIIDETLSNLDTQSTKLILNWINDIQEKSPKTWIFISHQLFHIQQVCNKIIFMDKGQILHIGTTEDILRYQGEGPLRDYIDERIIDI